MLNVFHKDGETRYIRYRQGFIKESENKIPFKYYKLSDSDISREDFLKGVEMQNTSLTIRTMDSYNFTMHTQVLINDRPYKVGYIYREEDDCANGLFRKNVKPYTYLVLNG